MPTSTQTYGRIARYLHWTIALLIVAQFAGGKVMLAMDGSALKFEIYQLHKSFGIIVLVLSLIRLLWRLTHKPPSLPNHMGGFEKLAAKATHVVFYVLMIGIPIAGWIMVSSAPTRIATKVFKIISWPDFPGITRSEGLFERMKDVHEYMALGIIVLLVLHIGAALKHHIVDKDDVLTRMLPWVKVKG